jgi:hypothetical protein
MPSIASGLTDARSRPVIRKAVSNSRLLNINTAGNSTNAGQVTPGKRKASDMDIKVSNDTSFTGRDHVSSTRRNSFSLREAEMEESPRVKRMRLAPRDSYYTEMGVHSAGTGQVDAARGMWICRLTRCRMANLNSPVQQQSVLEANSDS